MNEKDNFALVPRMLSALERAEPATKRILSDMVADTLALAKKEPSRNSRPFRIVQVNDETIINELFDLVIRNRFPDATVLSFDNAVPALEELTQADPDLLITDDMMAGMDGLELCQCLLDRKVTYPIIMTSSCDKTEQWVHEFANQGLNVSFLPFPCNCASLRNLMEMALKIRCEGIENPVEIVPQSRRTHVPRIVILDDEPTACDAIRMMLQLALPNAEILTFTNVEAALEELEREDPDLFTTDFQHPGMKGDKLLQLLAKRKVKYPVFVISAWGGMIEQELLKPVAQGLNVTLLPKPFTHEQLRLLLSKHLDPGKGLKLPKGAP